MDIPYCLGYPHIMLIGPKSLASELLDGWRERIELLFQGKALNIQVLGRIDLVATKIYAFCNREDDFQDVLKLKPTVQELERIYPWVLERDASSFWPERVDSCFARLRRSLCRLHRLKSRSF